jgi:hypothetical protein
MPPILNIIHLENRLDRLQSLMEETNLQNIAYKVWPGVTTHQAYTNHRNINSAHKAIVKDAQEKKLPQVIIAEDDIKFSEKGAWKYYLSQTPKEFDLYAGVIYDGEVDPETNRIISTKGMSGTNTLYTISEKFYPFFLATDNSKHLDRELGRFGNINQYYVCSPMVVTQIGGWSDNHKRTLHYDEYLRDIKLYGQ